MDIFRLPFSSLKISNKRETHKLKHIIQVWLQVQTTNTFLLLLTHTFTTTETENKN